ncbi:MAG TPA: antibiotic biosynthesis monooxygenase, partial [Paracoccaceae bacterium]|nr:antibiotic biosynthesis monooxygenase [Paracoccaceae bacterium]
FAVIFSNQLSADSTGYSEMATAIGELAAEQSGYLGIESTRDTDGFGITVSYWATENDVVNWRNVSKHQLAQKLGRERWYDDYVVRVAKVERAYAKD